MTPKQFNKRMNVLAKLIVKNVDAGFRAVALKVDQVLVLSTPVDTGRARSNWVVQGGIPRTQARDPFAPGLKGSTAGENTNAALLQARKAIAENTADTLYISNNVPYILVLNNGSSAQAPAGFIEAGVNAGVEEVRRIKALAGA